MATKGDAATRKKALQIVRFLGILVLLCCVGGSFAAFRTWATVETRMRSLDAKIAQGFADGAVWRLEEFFPQLQQGPDSVRVPVIGLPESATPDRHLELVDRAWRVSCEAFAEGGIGVDQIALGRPADDEPRNGRNKVAPHAGYVIEWSGSRYPVADAIARNGVAEPPEALAIEWLRDTVTGGALGGDEE
jgi:hypothetical protein